MKKRAKSIKCIIMAFVCSSFFVFSVACVDNTPTITAPNYQQKNSFSFSAYMSPPTANVGVGELRNNPNFITLEQYEYLKACGFDSAVATHRSGYEDVIKALDLSKEVGVKYYVLDYGLNQTIQSLIYDPAITTLPEAALNEIKARIDQVKDHEAFGGFTLSDEPAAERFDNIKLVKDWYTEYLPNADYFLNMLPYGCGPAQLGGYIGENQSKNDKFEGRKGYENFLTELMEKVNPSYLSYDYYALSTASTGAPKLGVGHLANFEIYSNFAKQYNIPFHNFILTMGHWQYRTPSNYDDLAWQVYSSMAFGSKGAKTFTYWTTMSTGEQITYGLIDWYGNRTQTYYSMQQLISEVRAMDVIYSNFNYDKTVAYLADEDYFNTMYDLLVTTAVVEKGSAITAEMPKISNLTANNDFIIGKFIDGEQRDGYMLSNIVDPAFDISTDISITFPGAKEVLINKKGKTTQIKIYKGVYNTTLGSGEGQFIIPLY